MKAKRRTLLERAKDVNRMMEDEDHWKTFLHATLVGILCGIAIGYLLG